MKRGRKKGTKVINGKVVKKLDFSDSLALLEDYSISQTIARQQRIKLIDHIRNVILPGLEGEL